MSRWKAKHDKEHYYNVRNLNLATRPRSELVNDKYSTWESDYDRNAINVKLLLENKVKN